MSIRRFACLALVAAWAAAAAVAMAAEPKLSEADLKKIDEALPEKAAAKPQKPRKVLLFSRCEGFKHTDGILGGNAAFARMGKKTGAFETDESVELSAFAPENLAKYDAVVFNNTTQLKFEKPELRKAFVEFVEGGKGVVGVHASTDSFYVWPEGAAIMGALFWGHPWGRCAVKLDDPEHPLLAAFDGKGFYISEEMYRMKEPYSRDRLRVLLSMDLGRMTKEDAEKGRPDRDNPIAWIQQVGKGRVFYCSFGHGREIFFQKPLLQFYLDGIQYALGDLPADATPSARLSPQPKPALAPPEGQAKGKKLEGKGKKK